MSTAALAIVIAAASISGCFGESNQTMLQGFGSGGGLGAPGGGDQDEVLPPFVPAQLSMRRMLGWQYRNAIHDLLGVEAANVVTPPADSAVNGFDAIGAAQLSLSTQAVEQYEASSYKAVQLALQDNALHGALIPCAPNAADDAECLRTVIEGFGLHAWRRPLTEDELQTWIAIGQQAGTAYGDFDHAVEFTLAGMLQSPNFLYLSEVGEPDPADATRLRLTSYELASRLSFFLNGTLPDSELLNAAESGALETTDGLRAQAERLVEKPEARDALGRFFDEAYQLRDVDSLVKDPDTYPDFTPALAKSMHQETKLLLADVVWDRDGDFRDVLDATYTFVDPELASLYGVAAPNANGFGKVQLDPGGRRGGMLGQAGFLALMAHPRTTSPTHRGKFVRERLLCGSIPAPPANVDTTLKESATSGPQTMRMRLSEHMSNPACSGCHAMMDGVGLGLENFDGLGRYRDTDQGLPIDASAQLDDGSSFAGALELGHQLREDPRVSLCLVRNVFRMATGHVDTEGEYAPLRMADKAFAANGYKVKALLVDLAASDAFRYAQPLEVQP